MLNFHLLSTVSNFNRFYDSGAPTEGDDTLFAVASTPLHALDGHDTVNGSRGNDVLFGDAGNDRMFGLSGDDLLDGGEGDDLLKGGDGHDQLLGGRGNDRLYDGAGTDWVFGGAGCDTLFLAADFVRGSSGADWLDGGDGLDLAVLNVLPGSVVRVQQGHYTPDGRKIIGDHLIWTAPDGSEQMDFVTSVEFFEVNGRLHHISELMM